MTGSRKKHVQKTNTTTLTKKQNKLTPSSACGESVLAASLFSGVSGTAVVLSASDVVEDVTVVSSERIQSRVEPSDSGLSGLQSHSVDQREHSLFSDIRKRRKKRLKETLTAVTGVLAEVPDPINTSPPM